MNNTLLSNRSAMKRFQLQLCIGLFLTLTPLGLTQAIAQPSGGEASSEEPPPPPPTAPPRPNVEQPAASHFMQFGVYAGGALTPNAAEFATLPGLISCQGDTTLYGNTTGGGFVIGASVGMSPIPAESFLSHIGWNLKLGLSSSSASFETEELIGQSISLSGELSSVMSTYTVDASVTTLLIEPTAYYQVSATAPLTIGLGPSLGVLMGATYEQKEAVTSPTGATFADGRTERNVREGDIEETTSMLVGGTLSLGYDIRVSPVFVIRPELSGVMGFSKVVSETDWTQHALRFGVSLLYNSETDLSTPLGPTN